MDAVLLARFRKAERDRRTPKTIGNYENAYRHYQDWLDREGLTAREVTPYKFEEYVDYLLTRFAVSTTKTLLAPVRAAYIYDRAIAPQMACPDPTITVTLPNVPESRPRVFTVDELRAMRDVATGERNRLLFYSLAFTGCRVEEVSRIKWADIDFSNGMIDVIGKGGKFRQVPLHPEFRRQLERIPEVERTNYVLKSNYRNADPTRPLTTVTISYNVKNLARAAGVENVTCHVFRKTVATTMLQAGARFGVTTPTIDKIMGWAPSSVSERHYYDVPTEAMHSAINVLYPGSL